MMMNKKLFTLALVLPIIRETDDEIRMGISGNLCRCTGYQNIVKSIQYAAAEINGTVYQEAAE